MKAYVVIEYPNIEEITDIIEDAIMPFVVGIFSKKSIARKVIENLIDKNKNKFLYFIEEYQVNNIYYKTEEELEKEVSESVEKMVKEGILDYKIGEDGQFYFEVTKKGEKEI